MNDQAPQTHGDATDALERLSKAFGLELADGALFVPFDDFYECVVSPAADGRLAMEIALIMVESGNSESILRDALRLNANPSATAGGSISLDLSGSVLTLKAFTAADPRNPDAVGETIARLIEAGRGLIDRLAAAGADAPPPSPETPFDPLAFLIRA
jgi:hypothetical protein